MTDSTHGGSSFGEPTPSATPPLSDRAKDSPGQAAEVPPPPPESRQFTPGQLPLGGLRDRSARDDTEAASTAAVPPASRAGGMETPRDRDMPGGFDFADEPQPTPAVEDLPGAFPEEEEEEEQPTTSAREFQSQSAAPKGQANDDFDSAFAGFGDGVKTQDTARHEEDPFAPSSSRQQPAGYSSEFPPIQSLEHEDDEESSDEEGPERGGGFDDDFQAGSAPRNTGDTVAALPGHGPAELSPPAETENMPTLAPQISVEAANIAGARPAITSLPSTASDLPTIEAQKSPPTYEQSDAPSHGGHGERSSSNHFPPEFGGLLPAREDPTSPPPADHETPQQAVVTEEKEVERPGTAGTATGQSLYPSAPTPSSSEVFHDAFSRPVSSFTGAAPERMSQAPPAQQKSAFDDFDDFGGLSEAKEAEKGGSGFDFGGFGHQNSDDFDSTFDSPTASMSTTMTSSQHTSGPSNSIRQDGFSNFQPNSSSSPFDAVVTTSSSLQNTPQGAHHDWDAIFSGLDNGKGIDTSLTGAGHDDPWGTPAAATTNGTAATAERTPTAGSPVSERTTRAPAPIAYSSQAPQQQRPQPGRALTPDGEHDDPFLKRLTGMGYPRAQALNALERYDYDINKVSSTYA